MKFYREETTCKTSAYMDLSEVGWEGVNWMHLAQMRNAREKRGWPEGRAETTRKT